MEQDLIWESSAWRSRGYIPHIDEPDRVQLITIRLHDAVPVALIEQWKVELNWIDRAPAADPRNIALRKRIDKYEDAGRGTCWLKDDRIAAIVQSALLHFDEERYRILGWCVMPNHVHVIVEFFETYPMQKILHSWKSYTAHQANKLLNRSERFWFLEYHDRFIRDAEHLANEVAYVENNPVKAGLVKSKEDWRWSSASRDRSRTDFRPGSAGVPPAAARE